MDALLRAINQTETIRVVAATTSEAVREACRRQRARGSAAVAIGRGITCGVLLATLAKQDKERLRIQFAGEGPGGNLLIDAHGDGRVRACLEHTLAADHPALQLPHDGPRASTSGLIGRTGHVTVTRDLGLGQGYQGSVEIATGEVDEDLQHYLDHSEQLPSALCCEVVLDHHGDVVRAAGVLAQSFPGSPIELITEVRELLAPGALASLLATHERSLDELVGFALAGRLGFRRMLEYPVVFHCPCGPSRAMSVLATLGASDLDALADEQEVTEVRCNFCGKVTRLSAAEVREVAARLRASQS